MGTYQSIAMNDKIYTCGCIALEMLNNTTMFSVTSHYVSKYVRCNTNNTFEIYGLDKEIRVIKC